MRLALGTLAALLLIAACGEDETLLFPGSDGAAETPTPSGTAAPSSTPTPTPTPSGSPMSTPTPSGTPPAFCIQSGQTCVPNAFPCCSGFPCLGFVCL